LLTVEGVKPGTLVRFAGLDNYNGIVWGAANDSGTEPGNRDTFQKVGSVINNPVSGTPVTAKITVEKGYSGVWLPSIGALEGINFGGGLDEQSEDFRYNLATDTGVVPGGIQPGDTYSIKSVLPSSKLDKDVQPWSGALPGSEAGGRFQALAAQWAGEGDSPLGRVLAVADHLRAEGKYTDGESGFEQFRAGHSLSRLTEFVAADHQLAGDDEQYAAMMALLANQLGVPARVVMGAAVPEDGVIKGRDVHAWVELRAADGSWRTLPTKDFLGTDTPDEENPTDKQLVAGKVIPPPAPVRPPSTAGDPVQDGLNRIDQHHDSDFQIPAFVIGFLKYVVLPLALLAAIFALIVGLKRRRRRLRRTRGTPARRLYLAWHDLLDHARDHGHSVTGRSTRREQAVQTGVAGFGPLARGADAHIFGRTDPTDSDAEAYWAQVDSMREQMVEPLSRLQRLKGAVNLASFRRLEGRSS
jgi:transglutaminase-like putative cysteine protease